MVAQYIAYESSDEFKRNSEPFKTFKKEELYMQTFKINCKKESLILIVIIHINISKKVNKEAFR